MHTGLIGGIGPAATEVYYRRLVRLHADAKQRLSLTIVHGDAAELVANLEAGCAVEQAAIFARYIDQLRAGGCEAVAVTSMGAHFCIKDLAAIFSLPRLIKFDNFEINGRYFLQPNLSLSASYMYRMASFDSSTGNAFPHWNQVMAQADYSFSQRTDVYLEGVYQRVGGGNGIPAFDAGVYTLTPATGNQQVVVAVGLRHRF
jgi:predicted porin